MSGNTTVQIQGLIDRLKAGEESARDELLNVAIERLRRLTRKMLRSDPRVGRWVEADDVLQNAAMRLYRSLKEVIIPAARDYSVRNFFGLATEQIRRELLDLARHYYGPEGLGRHHATHVENEPPDQASSDPGRLVAWTEFHRQVSTLPAEEREVFELLWYQGLPQAEAARLLDCSERTVKRRYREAKLRLHEVLKGELPGS
jgi:RNA polymerase sigma factor (sigma-70 family)